MGLQHAFGFNQPSAIFVDYLVVGGGGGGAYYGGGGGAGGYIQGSDTLYRGTQYPIVIGAGGEAGVFDLPGNNGSGSTFNSVSASGGGGGGGGSALTGKDGASGGGAAAGSLAKYINNDSTQNFFQEFVPLAAAIVNYFI